MNLLEIAETLKISEEYIDFILNEHLISFVYEKVFVKVGATRVDF